MFMKAHQNWWWRWRKLFHLVRTLCWVLTKLRRDFHYNCLDLQRFLFLFLTFTPKRKHKFCAIYLCKIVCYLWNWNIAFGCLNLWAFYNFCINMKAASASFIKLENSVCKLEIEFIFLIKVKYCEQHTILFTLCLMCVD
jgi:hypothetical protein